MTNLGQQRNKYLLKNTVIFSIGNFGTKIISFFLVPLYTNILTTREYGTVDLIYTIGMVLVPLLTLNIGESIMRFALDKDADCDKIMSTGITILIFGAIIGLLILPIANLFESVSNYSIYIYLYTLTLAFSQIFLCYLRGKEFLLKYSIGNIIQSLTIAIFNIIFLIGMKKGIEGYLMAYILANVCTGLYGFWAGKVNLVIKKYSIDIELSKNMIKYSVVLIPNSFMWWIMNSSDRMMVSAMISVTANGVYAVAYKIPTLLSTITTIFNQAWSYSAIREDESEDKEEYNNRVYDNLVTIVIVVATGLLMIMKPFLSVYVGKEYYAAWHYVPYLIVGFVFMTLGSFIATSYTVHKDSMGFLISGTVGAIINLILNFILIPMMGVSGAAFATCISYFGVFAYRIKDTQKYIKLRVFKRKQICGYALLILSAMTCYLDNCIGQTLLVIEFICIILLNKEFVKDMLKIIFKIKMN
ncbi:polysaccharide biosynthesis protein [[Clostridium] nexile DSM 1787]|jgi:O-antigen/teichoic acid export membrane protein|uniref:lipopolysaccharide biosynthesis protein n=1 Tax=Bacteria TaxID=2 RepID=UPI0001835A78|nr:polysaccharide biosynthesis protein [[Clostridium] nexile DSM 1787]